MMETFYTVLTEYVTFQMWSNCCCKGYGMTLHPGIRLLIKSAATSAFGRPTSLDLSGCIVTKLQSIVQQEIL